MNMEEFQKYMVSKRRQTYIQMEYTLYGVHLHEILGKAQLICTDIKQICNCERPVVGVEQIAKKHEGTFGSDGNILILDQGGGYTGAYTHQIPTAHFLGEQKVDFKSKRV